MFIIIMGVSGCGKSTIGAMLAERLGWPFYDGDDFHPAANIAKMAAGVPLNDTDRADWLTALGDMIDKRNTAGAEGVLACSALKESYRGMLRRGSVQFVYLKGNYETILRRMEMRGPHFMKPDMLQSQFAALEEPAEAVTLDVDQSPTEIVQKIMGAIKQD